MAAIAIPAFFSENLRRATDPTTKPITKNGR